MNLCLIDPKLCVTHRTCPVKVNKYHQALVNGAIFPPIEVMIKDGQYLVKDGNHRSMAHLKANELVWAYVMDEEDFEESRWLLGRRLGNKQ